MMGADEKGLGFVIGNAADAQVAFHMPKVFVKFGTKRSVFDIVDRPVKSFFSVVNGHSGAAGAEMGMVVCSEKQVKDTIFF